MTQSQSGSSSGSSGNQQNIQPTEQNFKQWGDQISREVTRELENRFSSSSGTNLTRDDVTKAIQQIDFTNLVKDAVSGGAMRREQSTSKA